jgi:cardiolipin synthase
LFSFFLPWLGALLFFILGSPKLPQWRRDRQREIDERIDEAVARAETDPALAALFERDLPAHYGGVAALVEQLGELPVFGGNSGELLHEYAATIDRIAADIDGAARFVHMVFYIFANDASGDRVAAALERAAARGVTCRVLVDALGSRAYLKTLLPRLRAAGVEIHTALPLRVGRHFTRPDLRNHRKIVVIDGCIGYTGSQNIVDAAYKPGIIYEEVVARVTGPIVAQLQAVFLSDWYSETDEQLAELNQAAPRDQLVPVGDVPAHVLPSGPAYDTANVSLLFTTLLYTARRRAVLTTPYFIPDAALLTAIESAARRGVEVHLIVSAQGDQFLVSRAQRSYYEELLAAGVRIHPVKRPAFIHAKHLSIDDDLVVVGSSNLDVRSFQLNLEIVLVVYDHQANATLRTIEHGYLRRAEQLSLAAWQQRPRTQQFVENTIRLVSAVL